MVLYNFALIKQRAKVRFSNESEEDVSSSRQKAELVVTCEGPTVLQPSIGNSLAVEFHVFILRIRKKTV